MEVERILYFEGVGDVAFRRNPRARRLTIRVKSDGKVRVTVPYMISYQKAALFVENKSDWIIKVRQGLADNVQKKTIFDEHTKFETEKRKLELIRNQGDTIRGKITDDTLGISVPVHMDIYLPLVQEAIRKIIIEVWREEAREILVRRLDILAREHHFRYHEVRIKNMHTRWGSCSRINNISLNLHLVRIPGHLRDYVLIHELVHTVHKNHGPDFWRLLGAITGDARALATELRQYNADIW